MTTASFSDITDEVVIRMYLQATDTMLDWWDSLHKEPEVENHNITALSLLLNLVEWIDDTNFNTITEARSFKGKWDVWKNNHAELLAALEEDMYMIEVEEDVNAELMALADEALQLSLEGGDDADTESV